MPGCPFAFTVQLLYGGIGDAIALTVTAPLNRIALILQTQQQANTLALPYDDGVMECGRRLIAEQGIWSLWQGNFIAFGYTTAFKSLSIFWKDYFLQHYSSYFLLVATKKDDDKQKKQEDQKIQQLRQQQQLREANQQAEATAGILAGCASIVILYPIHYALTCIMTGAGGKRDGGVPFDGSVQECIVQTIRTTGLFGLYQGLGMMLGSFLNYQIVYSGLFKSFPTLGAGSQWWKQFTVGQLVGCLAGCLSYPMDTISRRQQVQTALSATQQEGVAPTSNSEDLFAGMTAKLLSNALYNGILVLYNSERNQDWIRKVIMKFFH